MNELILKIGYKLKINMNFAFRNDRKQNSAAEIKSAVKEAVAIRWQKLEKVNLAQKLVGLSEAKSQSNAFEITNEVSNPTKVSTDSRKNRRFFVS